MAFIELGEGDSRRLVNLDMLVVAEPRGPTTTRLTLKNGEHLTFELPFSEIALCIELEGVELRDKDDDDLLAKDKKDQSNEKC